MINTVDPRDFHDLVHTGSRKLSSFRKARLQYIREYVGQHYDCGDGMQSVGRHPLNLIYNAISAIVPNMVMSRPTHKVRTPYIDRRFYARLLGLGLEYLDERLDIDEVYRCALVDALFTLGVVKTGLADNGSVYTIDQYDPIGDGEIFTKTVDFDAWVVDPKSRAHMFEDARFMGDRIDVRKEDLLASGMYNNELVEKMPTIDELANRKQDEARTLWDSRGRGGGDAYADDYVSIYELWIPHDNVIVSVPAYEGSVSREYLRVDDYYGPESGPYTLLALTQPVPGNPLPVPAVSIWFDLHILANEMAEKVIRQAMKQKNLLIYQAESADDAQEILDADDEEAVQVANPDQVKSIQLGGQAQSNEVHLSHLQVWFNEMAGNPNALQGIHMDADSATEASILANQATIRLEDQKNAVYKFAAAEGRKRAWYLHTDPMIKLPLTERVRIPPVYQQTPMGPQMVAPPMTQEIQVYLTPEARRGQFLDYTFTIEPESMAREGQPGAVPRGDGVCRQDHARRRTGRSDHGAARPAL
jgi:hypothetical protein